MLKVVNLICLISFLIASSAAHTFAQQSDSREVDEIKNDISRLYANSGRQVVVHMKNGTKEKGYINAMESETFTLESTNSGRKISIRYADVSKVTEKKNGLSKGQKTALGVAAVGAIIAVVVIFQPKRSSGGLRCLFC